MATLTYALLYPETYSLSAVATVETSTSMLEGTLSMLMKVNNDIRKNLVSICNLYAALDAYEGTQSKQDAAKLQYPSEESSPAGMSLEIRFAILRPHASSISELLSSQEPQLLVYW